MLSRNSRDFLDSKKTVEAQRDALEEQLAAAEERQQALLREQKEKAKLVKEAAHYRNEMELRLATLEKSLFDARKEKKATELSAEKAQAQGRADREVLVECVRQMASKLATARAAAEAATFGARGLPAAARLGADCAAAHAHRGQPGPRRGKRAADARTR